MPCLAGREPRFAYGDGSGVHGARCLPRRGYGVRLPQAGVHERAVAAAHGRGEGEIFRAFSRIRSLVGDGSGQCVPTRHDVT